MDWGKLFSKKRIMFLLVFFALVLIGKNINFSAVVGANSQFFTLFQLFGPIAGGFLGPLFGGISVLLAQAGDYLIIGKEWTWINLIRLLPMLFAVWYFGSKKRYVTALVPALCMILFVIHPIGQEAWLYSLYWLIPILGAVLPQKIPGRLWFRSFGATFTAHAIGSVVWLYTVPMEASAWLGLIPVVAFERFVFGMGIACSYVVFNTVMLYLIEKFDWKISTKILFLDRRYSLFYFLNPKPTPD